MPVEFLGIAATSDGSETSTRSTPPRPRLHAAAGPRPRGARLGPGAVRLLGGHSRPGGGRRYVPPSSTAPGAARAPTQRLHPTVAAKTFATPGPDQRRPAHGALHHRRHRPRSGARGRLPDQGPALRPDRRVHPDREAGLDQPRSVRPPGRVLSLRRLRLDVSRSAPTARGLLRRLLRGGVRGGRRRGGHLLPVGRAAGARPPRRSSGSGRLPLRPAAAPRRASRCAFRPIIAPTEELAWEKAHRTVATINARNGGRPVALPPERRAARPARRRPRRTPARSA